MDAVCRENLFLQSISQISAAGIDATVTACVGMQLKIPDLCNRQSHHIASLPSPPSLPLQTPPERKEQAVAR